jgi:hypothetical protein
VSLKASKVSLYDLVFLSRIPLSSIAVLNEVTSLSKT